MCRKCDNSGLNWDSKKAINSGGQQYDTGESFEQTTGSGNDTGAKKSVSGGLPDWKNIVRHVGRRVGQPQDRQTGRYADQSRSNHTGGRTERSQHSISAMPQEGGRKKSHPQYSTTAQQKNKAWRQEQGHPGNAYEQNVYKDNAYSTRVRQRRVRAERQRRRRQARIRRYIKISLLCASILAGIFMLKICWKYLPALRRPVLLWKLRQKLCSGSKNRSGRPREPGSRDFRRMYMQHIPTGQKIFSP